MTLLPGGKDVRSIACCSPCSGRALCGMGQGDGPAKWSCARVATAEDELDVGGGSAGAHTLVGLLVVFCFFVG